jgi:hypothetical protein
MEGGMRTIRRALPALLLVALGSLAAAASAQTAAPGKSLDEHLEDALETGTVPDRALLLAAAEAAAQAQSGGNLMESELRAAINRQRTDLQQGAASGAPQAVSILEKPGIADLLMLAVDRGAITRTAGGTGVTLSTTPYAFRTGFGATDTPRRWKSAVVARNLSFSATFSSSSTDASTADFSSLTSGEVKYIVFGNRSPRDPELLGRVRESLGRTFRVADDDLDRTCGWLLNDEAVFRVQAEMNTWLHAHPNAAVADARVHLLDLVRPLRVDQERMRPCIATVTAGEQLIQGGLDAVTTATRAYLAEHPGQLAVATLFVRDPILSDYYSAKLLYGYDRSSLTLNLNAETSWNRSSTTPGGLRLRSVRAYSVELGVTSKTLANGRLDGSLASRASREEALDAASIVMGEAKLNLHLNGVLRLPLTLTYANRETRTIRRGWQLNVGVSALLDEVLRRP